jgi:hypothetical protein
MVGPSCGSGCGLHGRGRHAGGANWRRALAQARVAYGLSRDEFAHATAADLAALREAREAADRREDARFALVCSVLANCHRDPKRRARPYQVEDFMPRSNEHSQKEFDAKLKRLAAMSGVRVIKPKPNTK